MMIKVQNFGLWITLDLRMGMHILECELDFELLSK